MTSSTFDNFDEDEWSEHVKKINKDVGELECECCKNLFSKVTAIGFIYCIHKHHRGYGDFRKLCDICIDAFTEHKIPLPCDYEYFGKLVTSDCGSISYEVDVDYYLHYCDENSSKFLTFHTNSEWQQLSDTMQKELNCFYGGDD